jgi:hypothetical protein
LSAQTEAGPFRENWDHVNHRYYFQGFDEFGFHPGPQALCVEHLLKLHALVREKEGEDPNDWRTAAERAVNWLISLLRPDGSLPQTVMMKAATTAVTVTSAGNMAEDFAVRSQDYQPGQPAPLTRLLSAFSTIYPLLGRDDVEQAMRRHEAWVIEHACKPQCWWGHWPDTNLTTTIYAAIKFIEYCVKRHRQTGEDRYLIWASETAYHLFFAMVPKQSQRIHNYIRGAVIEQDNYMQYNSCSGDNLVMWSLATLGRETGDPFLRDMALQCFQTVCHSISDDPRHPWYGAGNMYVAEPLGLTVPFDTDPATGGATKYAGSVVNMVLEDIRLGMEMGLFARE